MKNSFGLGSRFGVGAELLFALVLLSCQPSSLVASLDAVISAAEIALPVIGSAAGLSPQTQAQIVSYLHLVDAATIQAADILAGVGTSAEKAAKIIGVFSAIAQGCNCIPPGTPQTVVAVVNAVVQAVAKFLGNFQSSKMAAAKPVSTKVTATDLAGLANIRNRAEKNAANLKAFGK